MAEMPGMQFSIPQRLHPDGKGPFMQYYVLFYHVVNDYIARRAPFREEHLRLAAAARDRGELVLGGALADPVDQAILVFRVPDPALIEAFVKADPYVRNGLVIRWDIRPWTVVIEALLPAR